MKIICECGFSHLPENFNAVESFGEESGEPMRFVYINCPACGKSVFFQHFNRSENAEKHLSENGYIESLSHLFAPTFDEVPKDSSQEEVEKAVIRKIKEFKEKWKQKVEDRKRLET